MTCEESRCFQLHELSEEKLGFIQREHVSLGAVLDEVVEDVQEVVLAHSVSHEEEHSEDVDKVQWLDPSFAVSSCGADMSPFFNIGHDGSQVEPISLFVRYSKLD